MAKLHELLAVGDDLKNQAVKCTKDLINTFDKKRTHFSEKKVIFKSTQDGVPDKVESFLGLQTTVDQELTWLSAMLVKAIDCGHQVDVANLTANADVVLENGTILLRGVPATSLLQLEKRLKEIQELVNAIPTLDPAQGFTVDGDRGTGIYRARDEERARTAKAFKVLTLAPATDKHAAQVEKYSVDEVVGHTLTQEWSSFITVARKSGMLERVEELIRAVKAARARANQIDVDVKTNKVGRDLLNYALYGTSGE